MLWFGPLNVLNWYDTLSIPMTHIDALLTCEKTQTWNYCKFYIMALRDVLSSAKCSVTQKQWSMGCLYWFDAKIENAYWCTNGPFWWENMPTIKVVTFIQFLQIRSLYKMYSGYSYDIKVSNWYDAPLLPIRLFLKALMDV